MDAIDVEEDIEQHAVSPPEVLINFLQQLTPRLLDHVQLQHQAELAKRTLQATAAAKSDVTSPSDGLSRFGTPIAVTKPASCSHSARSGASSAKGSSVGGKERAFNQPVLPLPWEKFRNLFPEIPIVLSRRTRAAKTSGDDVLWEEMDPFEEASLEQDGESAVRAEVGLQEVCSAALKALVSLSNDCSTVADKLLLKSGTLSWAVAMLTWCAVWRCNFLSINANSRETRGKQPLRKGVCGALSPDETALEVNKN